MRFEPGAVVLVRFPFTDLSAAKQRPALVLSSDEHQDVGLDVIVAAISGSRADDPGRYDHVILDWRGAGLLMPSVVRCAKLVTIERTIVKRVLGRVGTDELTAVRDAVREVLAL